MPEEPETLVIAATDPANPYGTTLKWPAFAKASAGQAHDAKASAGQARDAKATAGQARVAKASAGQAHVAEGSA